MVLEFIYICNQNRIIELNQPELTSFENIDISSRCNPPFMRFNKGIMEAVDMYESKVAGRGGQLPISSCVSPSNMVNNVSKLKKKSNPASFGQVIAFYKVI